jgi:hypothetical protein
MRCDPQDVPLSETDPSVNATPGEVRFDAPAPTIRYSLPENIAEEFLADATRSLLDACRPDPTNDAAARRMRASRESQLYAALAAEGYINRFIAEQLLNKRGFTDKDQDAIDRLAPVDKYVLVPRLAIGSTRFDRGAEPLQQLVKLFKRRNKLVHPKPRELVMKLGPGDDDARWFGPAFEDYTPMEACESLLAVAKAAITLDEASGAPGQDGVAAMLLSTANSIRRAASTANSPEPTINDIARVNQADLDAVRARLADLPD